ncbi:MAG TPA: alpha/beta fold hydrolase [Candidatus Limnocylindria bacterium]|nr:alpha/beta fold hydrolase [Candidatus Limnocylindria bacterium]
MRAKTIVVSGLEIRVLEAGEASATAVVMIHGVGGWAENWRDVMEPIARSGRRAIAVDLPGFGESQSPGKVPYFGPRDAFYPRFMRDLLDALEIRSAHIVGNSMGGSVAYMTAVTFPDRARSLSLVASGGLGMDIPLFLRLATLPGTVTLARLFGNPRQGGAVLRTCFYDAGRIPETLYAESERYGLRSYPEFVHALRDGVTIRGVKRGLREYWVAQAPRYRGPVLVVWGREDAVLPISHLDDSKAIYPDAEIHVIERCGHLPMVERTDEFLGALLPFVAGAEARAAA